MLLRHRPGDRHDLLSGCDGPANVEGLAGFIRAHLPPLQ
jgi:hypothetical protein